MLKRIIVFAIVIVVAVTVYNWVLMPIARLSERNTPLALGLNILIVTGLLALPVHYFLNVRRTTSGGVIEVSGFLGYVGHRLANLLASVVLGGAALLGILFCTIGIVF